MRIHRIEVEGFGPFRTPQTVDLDRYAADGIFLIAGRTGTGKSSILDAICFALYGSVPRYDDGDKRLRSDHSEPGEPTRVAVEFTAGDARWRVERSPEYQRPKQRGEGMTTEAARVDVFEQVDGAWVGRASRAVDAARAIDRVVGLNQQQFLQVILLAQGRFARFLLAKNDDRQKLLRTLFGTRRFQDYETALDERRKHHAALVGTRTETLRAILEQAHSDVVAAEVEGDAPEDVVDDAPSDATLDARIARLEASAALAADAAGRAGSAEESARAERAAAEALRDEKRALRDGQRRRDDARERIARLDARRDELDAQRDELEAARRAEQVAPLLDAVARSREAAGEASRQRSETRAAWVAGLDEDARRAGSGQGADASGDDAAPDDDRATRADGARETGDTGSIDEAPTAPIHTAAVGEGVVVSPDATAADLDAFVDAANTRIGGWQAARDLETLLDDESARLDRTRDELAACAQQIASIAERRAALPERIAANQQAIDAAAERAARREAVEAHIDQLERQFAALGEVARLRTDYAAAQQTAQQATGARRDAEDALSALHARRLAGYAGELSAQLVPGEACAVCGSTTHPAPAPLADDHVTPDEIDAAEARRADAVAADEKASAARQVVQVELRAAEERAGGRSEVEISGDLLAAKDALADAETAAREKRDLERQRDELSADRDALAERTAALESERGTLQAAIAAAESDLAQHRAAVAAARGSFPSVAARIGAAQQLASRASALADALRDADRAGVDLAERTAELDAGLADAGFDSADAAREARRERARRDALDAGLSEASAERAAAQSALDEVGALDLPDDPVDVTAVEAALADAQRAYDRAVDARGTARRLANALAEASERAHAAHAEVAGAAREADDIARLADAVAGRAHNTKRMNLETFVLAAELEEIVEAGSRRLAEMSSGRYALQHTDALARRGAASGLGIEVMDRYTGQARPPHSLSGGETFLASLALALGLAEVVTNRAGGIRLDTLFIDEGFGSLDGETLDVAMHTLDALRQGGRTIGVISHVEAMKEQIPAQLRVRQTREGWSEIDQ